ncbi:alanine racemase [Fulvimarina sp. MAC8]|uniref:alanine racemase n=1 Tax=Fulvimarina sp. MAC8 TaxID=3162874 RepID=UPI0032F054B4
MPRVEIDRGALQRNWAALAAMHPDARTGAAIKANGYGLGAETVARSLFTAGCRDFFVAWPEEGLSVRREIGSAGRIFVLQGIEPAAVEVLAANGLIPVLSNLDDLTIWAEGIARLGQDAPAALQLETGMNRLGLDERVFLKAMDIVAERKLDIQLLLSHLASADVSADDTADQHRRFEAMTSQFREIPRSLANSAGIVCGERFGFDLTRPGMALYGGMACLRGKVVTEPVARFTAAVLQVREAESGEKAGYAGAARLSQRTRIATIGVGYGDGYPRALSGAGVPLRDGRAGPSAFLAGHPVPILGRISMDMTLLDISDLPDGAVKPGDRAELFGPQIPIDDVAEAAGTIAYELLTGLGSRVRRDWSC